MKTEIYCAALLLGVWQAAVASEMPVVELSAGVHRIQAEVAHTHQARTKGLMYRRSMPSNQGMMFVWPQEGRHCMWMRNTYLPLSVAFIDDQGRIVNVSDMAPRSEDLHCAAQPVRYALEMNQGWFAARRLERGARIAGLEKLPAAE